MAATSSRVLQSGRRPILGLGSSVLDMFFRVRSLPLVGEKGYFVDPEKVVANTVVGGVTLNHLSWASLLGAPTGLLALQGEDAAGRTIRAKMAELGVCTRNVIVDPTYATAVSHVYVDDAGERTIMMATGSSAKLVGDVFDGLFRDEIGTAGMVTAEICQVPLSGVQRLLAAANRASITSCVDVDVPPSVAAGEARLGTVREMFDVASACTVLKPTLASAAELLALAKTKGESTDPVASGVVLGSTPDQIAGQLQEAYGSRIVAVTDGSRGCAFAFRTEDGHTDAILVPAPHGVKQVDSTGAGDAFFGGLVATIYHLGLPRMAEEAVTAGSIAGALGAACCEVLGALPDKSSAQRLQDLLPQQACSWTRAFPDS